MKRECSVKALTRPFFFFIFAPGQSRGEIRRTFWRFGAGSKFYNLDDLTFCVIDRYSLFLSPWSVFPSRVLPYRHITSTEADRQALLTGLNIVPRIRIRGRATDSCSGRSSPGVAGSVF